MIEFLAAVVIVGVTFADPIPDTIPTRRIIGGTNTAIEEISYQVSIMYKGNHYCGGSIIDKYWVLTAAHCIKPESNAWDYTIHSGSSHILHGGLVHDVSRIAYHEDFDPISFINDIALIRLATPIVIGRTRQAVELYERGEVIQDGVYAVVSGWGDTNPNTIKNSESRIPDILQILRIPMISKDECKKIYKKRGITINPGNICAAYPKGGKGSCYGDSGGPLVIGGRLAGIVSWGGGAICAHPENPGVYTEVAHFRSWISAVMST